MITDFTAKYGIKVQSDHARRRTARTRSTPRSSLAGTGRQPDILDLGTGRRRSRTPTCTPRTRSRTWADIPDANKEADRPLDQQLHAASDDRLRRRQPRRRSPRWPTSLDPEVQGQGRPQRRPARGVAPASTASSSPRSRTAARPTTSPPASTSSRSSPTWATSCRSTRPRRRSPPARPRSSSTGRTTRAADRRQAQGEGHRLEGRRPVRRAAGRRRTTTTPINKDAPHPAAARCWMEYLFSDAGQNTWLKGFAPSRSASPAMQTAGTADTAALAALNAPADDPVMLTPDQTDKAKDYLTGELEVHPDQVTRRGPEAHRMTGCRSLRPHHPARPRPAPPLAGPARAVSAGRRTTSPSSPSSPTSPSSSSCRRSSSRSERSRTADGAFTLVNVAQLFTDEVFVERLHQVDPARGRDGDRRRDLRRPARLGRRPGRPERPAPPGRHRRVRRPRPVRRRHARVRVPRDVRVQRSRHDLLHERRCTSTSCPTPSWLYSLAGLAVVYTYFQIPLMLIVFLPSLDGLRQEWYDASDEPRRRRAGRSGGTWAGRSSRRASSARSSSCSRTRSPRTRRRPRSSARGARSSRSRSRSQLTERGRARAGERRQGASRSG